MQIRLHLTNVRGTGATQLLLSLLPALSSLQDLDIEAAYLPSSGPLSDHVFDDRATSVERYRRILPNILSRAFECLFAGRLFAGKSTILVFGDIPLRTPGAQWVFLQNPHLTRSIKLREGLDGIKYLISQLIFSFNIDRVTGFFVQTEFMRQTLIRTYNVNPDIVHVVSQPVPHWLLPYRSTRKSRISKDHSTPLHLFYPAADYPHKNHGLLAQLNIPRSRLDRITITIDGTELSLPQHRFIECTGPLSAEAIICFYEKVDALLFLSKEESYGFPLLEAMHIGIPVICPNLPYARCICGDQAIYFEVTSHSSLSEAIAELDRRLKIGWWPDWSERLREFPQDWPEVARLLVRTIDLSIPVSDHPAGDSGEQAPYQSWKPNK